MDAKDILGLPKISFPSLEKKSRPPKESQRKPDGISREVLITIHCKIFKIFIVVTELSWIFSLGLCSYWRIATSYAYNWILSAEKKASFWRKGLFLCFSHNTQLLSWFNEEFRFFLRFFRSLGNGFLSPILLARIIFIFTIGSVMVSISFVLFFYFGIISDYELGIYCYVSLLLQVRVVNGVPPTGDYSFAKYNKVNASVLCLLACLPFLSIWFHSRIWL